MAAAAGFADTITMSGTGSNVALTVENLTISDTTPAPGTAFTIAMDVVDANGRGDITDANISCYGTGGTQWTDGWDSITVDNSSLTWSILNTSAVRITASISTSVNYWSTKSINGTWTCQGYASDSASAADEENSAITVDASAGLTLGQSTCSFTAGNPGATNTQWACNGDTNDTITHNGNVVTLLQITGANLAGQTDASWFIAPGNITWNQTDATPPTSEAGTALTASAATVLNQWTRGTAASRTINATNLTTWLDYPTPLKAQVYQGDITLTATAV